MDEFMDNELAGMVNYIDDTVPKQVPATNRRTIVLEGSGIAKEEIPRNNEPRFLNEQRSLLDRMKTSVLWLGVCGGIAMLLWWFWQNDLMALKAAYPCILACGVIGAFGAGLSFRK